MPYVIKFNSCFKVSRFCKNYGYYIGKNYLCDGELIPICNNSKNKSKKFKNSRRAKKSAEKICNGLYGLTYIVERVNVCKLKQSIKARK